MKDRFAFDDTGLPPELAELDAELASIRYEERPSFGPELEAELARVWRELPPPGRRGGSARQLLAASVTGLLMVGLAVPSARAALVRWVEAVVPVAPQVAATPAPPASPYLMGARSEPPQNAPFDPPRPLLPREDRAPVREAWEGPEVTFPELADRVEAERLILERYPPNLQRLGTGGTVGLLLFVDDEGAVDVVNVGRSSGVPGLDVAAVAVAPSLRFEPARRRGEPVGTWVQFDVVFRAPTDARAVSRPAVPEEPEVATPDVPDAGTMTVVPEWKGGVALPSPVRRESGELLLAALGDDELAERLGSVERILAGDPPPGVAPTSWRAEVSAALEAAMVRDPDNPAPLLALGRIRRNQGLRTEARVLFERGLQRAIRGGETVSPAILAELHFERGRLMKQNWLASRRLGRLPAEALPPATCAQARSSGGAASGYSSVERLVAWNYLCPAQLRAAMAESFEYLSRDTERDFAVMMGSFRSAVEAVPGHVGANVEILLALADDGRWQELLDGSRRFVWGSRGHPYAVLLSGLALQRMGRSEEAQGQFRMALSGLDPAEREAVQDLRPLLPSREAERYLRADADQRTALRTGFFAGLDPILSTPVNEREVEHLARAVYAHLRFAGTDTDAGRIWVRYGRPDEIRVVGEGAGLRTEFWDYGEGPDVTFQRPATTQAMALTPEARVYVDDLVSVYPHRYGAEARPVMTLEGDVRSAAAGSGVDVEARIPVELVTAAADSLDVGIFLLDAEGRALWATQGKVAGAARPLDFRGVATVGGATLVVEIFNPASGHAAVLRHVLDRTADGAGSAPDEGVVFSSVPLVAPDGALVPPRPPRGVDA